MVPLNRAELRVGSHRVGDCRAADAACDHRLLKRTTSGVSIPPSILAGAPGPADRLCGRHATKGRVVPVKFDIDSEAQKVEAYATGTLSAGDILDYLEKVAEAGAMAYAKLFDASQAKATISVGELKALGAWVRAYSMDGRGPVGPLAIVVSSATYLDAAHFADAAGSNRPLRIFRDRGDAKAWLAQVLNPTTMGRR